MADNLEDFFAKRDKKKKSGKNKKFETTEELAKILGKKAEERKKLEEGKSQYVSEDPINITVPGNEDDEWLDHEEKQPDYSGLKIQELVLDDEDEAEVQEGKEPGDNVTNDGPWRKRSAVPQIENNEVFNTPSAPVEDDNEHITRSTMETEESTEPVVGSEIESAPAPAAAVVGGKYIPPSLKRAQEAAVAGGGSSNVPPPSNRPYEASGEGPQKGAYVPPGRRIGSSTSSATGVSKPRKPTTAPNIHDEGFFPSLGGS